MAAGTNNSVLVVDDNPSVRIAISHNLSKAGFEVSSAGNGIEGLESCQSCQPDLIISDIMMPEMDGIEFCKQVRLLPPFRSTPFIFLTARSETDQKILGLRTGADDYLVKPLDMGELTARVDNLIRKAHKISEPQALSGRLEEVCLADLLQMFEVSQKQGCLHLHHKDGRKADIDLHCGTILGTRIDSDLRGEEAFFELLGWTEAGFRFEPGELTTGEIMKSITYLLMEGMRLLDERKDLQQYLPQPDCPYTLAAGITAPVDSGTGEAPGILRLLASGHKTFVELAAATTRGTLQTEIAMAKLIRAGSILPSGMVAPLKKMPVGVMLAHSAEVPITMFLQTLGLAFNLPQHKTASLGVADYINIELDGISMRLFVLRGEKRFSTLWRLIMDRVSRAIFLTDGSKEGCASAEYFSQQLDSTGDQPPLICTISMGDGGAGECRPDSVDDIRALLRQLIN